MQLLQLLLDFYLRVYYIVVVFLSPVTHGHTSVVNLVVVKDSNDGQSWNYSLFGC